MPFAQRLEEIRAGFQPPFWVANFTEIFERVAYYATTAVLAIYLTEQLHFSSVLAGTLQGIAGFVVYALAILAGTLADRFGFRRTLLLAYLLLTAGYFLLGSLETPWMAPLRHAIGDKWLVSMVLLVPSLGPGLVKPVVAGTTARASSENVRSLGYSIYYTLVNIGGAVGPLMAWVVREKMGWGIANVFRFAALSVFLMFWVTLFFYREPGKPDDERVASIGRAFLEHVHRPRKSALRHISADFFGLLHCLLADFYFGADFPAAIRESECGCRPHPLARRRHDHLLSNSRRLPDAKNSGGAGHRHRFLDRGVFVDSSGRASQRCSRSACYSSFWRSANSLQASRYYEYCSRLAPPGQQGLYMGYAFLPIAIGYLVGGALGGYSGAGVWRRAAPASADVVGDRRRSEWPTAALMWLYGRIVTPVDAKASAS